MRVQIPVHTDAWMRGDRYGEVERTFLKERRSHTNHPVPIMMEMARVRLDKSKKIVIVKLDDCEVCDD